MSIIELRRVSTTGGIFKVEDYQVYKMIAKGLKASGKIVTITEGIRVDDFGRTLGADSVRLIINVPGSLSQDFWQVAGCRQKTKKTPYRAGSHIWCKPK